MLFDAALQVKRTLRTLVEDQIDDGKVGREPKFIAKNLVVGNGIETRILLPDFLGMQ